MFPSEKAASAQPGFVPRILAPSLSDPLPPNDLASALDAMPAPAVSPTLRFPTRTEERFKSPSEDAPVKAAKHYELRVEAQSLTAGGAEILPRDCVLADSISLPDEIVAAEHPVIPDASDLRRRRKFAIGAAAGMMGILALIVIASSITKTPAPDSGVQALQSSAQPAAVVPENPPQTKPATPTERTVKTAPSAAKSASDSAHPVPMVRVAVAPVPQDTGFMASLKALLGLDVAHTIDPATAALPVWTVQHSGFYYCAQSPDFRTLEPGAIMEQGQALQSGYQPKLGSYCQ
jgi:hypothetical protein